MSLKIYFTDGTVIENIALGETNPDKEKINHILDRLNLLKFLQINQRFRHKCW